MFQKINRWTCTGCTAVEETEAGAPPPPDWICLDVCQGDAINEAGQRTDFLGQSHYCGECAGVIKTVLQNPRRLL